jgi:hypothetical protein
VLSYQGLVALSIAAAVAIFLFKVGMIPTLAACCVVTGREQRNAL